MLTENYTELSELADCYSDTYKEAHGSRPRFDRSHWTVEDYRKSIQSLYSIIEMGSQRESEAHAANSAAIEIRIGKIIALGAKDRQTAIRWLHEAEGTNGDNSYLCYCLDLPSDYFGR